MLVCKRCKNTKLDGKWIPTLNIRKNVTYTLCPSCSTEVKQVSRGTLIIENNFFQQNNEQALNLIRSEEKRARSNNVYSRVVLIKPNRKNVIIKTTNSLLAIQIGKQFKRLYSGKLDISRDSRNRTRVQWIIDNTKTVVNTA